MSYIAYDIEAMNAVPAIATATGAPVGSIGWGLPQMWLWCIRNEQSIITDRHLQGFFGRIDDLGGVLATFGFLEPVEDGWLVRGAEKHLQRIEAKREAGRSSRQRQLTESARRPSKLASGAGPGVTPGSPQGNPRMTPGRPQSDPGVTQGQPRGNPGASPGKTPKNGPDPGQKRGLTPNTYLSPKGEREIGVDLESSGGGRKPGPPPDGGQAAPTPEIAPPRKPYWVDYQFDPEFAERPE